MNSSTISADIVSFTSLSDEDKRKIELQIKLLINDLTEKYSSYCRFYFMRKTG